MHLKRLQADLVSFETSKRNMDETVGARVDEEIRETSLVSPLPLQVISYFCVWVGM